jgi:GDPmannose 4,6-dehydratase
MLISILIIGITSQDGSNMARFLLEKYNNNINIIGCYNNFNKINKINDIINFINLCNLDLNNLIDIDLIVKKYNPDYIFNFASAQPQFENNNINFFKINTLSTIQFLDSIVKYNKNIKYFSAGSSLEYNNNNNNNIVDINNKAEPDNIYGITKLSNRLIINYYKNKYNLFLIHAILFNHDSPSRTDDFMSIKIIKHLIKVKKIIDENLNNEKLNFDIFEINNIFTYRDWSDSRDFIEAIWLMMIHENPDNYILSSFKEYSFYDLINVSLTKLNYINYEWKKENSNTILFYKNYKILISLFSNPIKNVIGNNIETLKNLQWKPKITFEQMVNNIISNIE